MSSQKEKIFEFIKGEYGVMPEFLWEKFPNYAVLRNKKNKKWFAIIMSVSKDKLGLKGDGEIEVMNIKCDEYAIWQLLDENECFLPAYHMNKKHWISVLLNDAISIDRIKNLLKISYDIVNKKS